jgi:O-antigen/teichoic acid export membrane protein
MKKINNLFLLTVASTGGSGITAVFWFIIATLLVPSEYGQIQYFISIAGLGYAISLIGTQTVITVYTAKKIQLQSTLILLSLVAGTVSGIVILFLFSKLDVSFLLIVFIINDISLGYILGKRFFAKYSKYFITQKSLTFGLGLSFYFIFGAEGIILGLALSYIHFVIIIFNILKSSKINFSLLKKHFGFVGNNYLINAVAQTKNHIDKIIVLPIIGFELLGNYALALQTYVVLMIFSKIIYNYTLPHDSVGKATTKVKIIALISSVIFTLLGVIATPFIIPAIFPEYTEAVIAIQIISLAVIPSTITLILSSKFLGDENSKIILIARIIFAIIIISLIVILTPIYGISGTTGSFVVASIAQTVILFVYYRLRN